MALYTQKAIMGAFGEMLEEMPFDKITVTALVKRCDISSNTFYYHYRDIYDLLDAWFHLELGRFTGEGTDWHTSTKAVMRECQAHPAKIYHVFNALSRDRMEPLSAAPWRSRRTEFSDKPAEMSPIGRFCRRL